MPKHNQARINMVDCQIRPADVTSHGVLEAMLAIPRERFVTEAMAPLAYLDEDIEVAPGRFLMESAPFAKLVQAADVRADDVVLDIGTATGYSAAILSRLASLVIAVEEDEALAQQATQTLSELDYDNTAVVRSPLRDGYAHEAPYDVIFVGGAVEELPKGLLEQLKDGGRLVAVEGHGNSAVAKLHLRNGDDFSARRLFNCALRPLPGFAKTPQFDL